MHLWRLGDILFSNVFMKQCTLRFGPLFSQLISIWRANEELCKISLKCNVYTIILNDVRFLIRGCPIFLPQWSKRGVHYLGDIFGDQGLCSFQEIQTNLILQASFFLIYLQIWSAL